MKLIIEAINGWVKVDLTFGHPLLEVTTDQATFEAWRVQQQFQAKTIDRFQVSAISAILKGGPAK